VFAVGAGQFDAALSLGFTQRETLTKIVLPQAVRTVIPPLGNLIIAMTKNSAILGGSLLAINDLLLNSRRIYNNNFKFFETFVWAAIGYLILTVTVTIIVRKLETRLAIKR
jgi:glutamate transport system permease protein